jgi:hypothetical protein
MDQRVLAALVVLSIPTTALAQPALAQPAPSATAPAPPPVQPAPYVAPPGELETVADFATVGLLAGITVDVRGVHDSGLGTFVLLGSTAGGGAIGWMLADHYQATRGDAYLTTLGLTVGMANGALLLQPLHETDTATQVLGVLTLSSAIGASAGFAASRAEKLTAGQAMFATNLTALGIGSAAVAASLHDHTDLSDGDLAALAIGLDAGAAAGLLLAPKVDWSQRRANVVGMGTLVGVFVGSMAVALASPVHKDANGTSTTDYDPRAFATALLVGGWGGFGASILLTKDMAPDPRYQQPSVALVPFVHGDAIGAAIGGSF